MRTLLATAIALCGAAAGARVPGVFRQNDSPMAMAINMGIFFMLGVVAVMLSAFAAFFIYLSRRARALESRQTAPAGRHVPSEGTASC